MTVCSKTATQIHCNIYTYKQITQINTHICIYTHIKIYIHKNSYKKSLTNELAVSAIVWNALKCFPNIFINNKMIIVHLLPCNKRLNCFTMLIMSALS